MRHQVSRLICYATQHFELWTKSLQAPALESLLNFGFSLIELFITILFIGWFNKNKGGTPGKLVFGLRVINSETGKNIGYLNTTGRIFANFLNIISLGIGYLILALRTDKKGFHDLAAGTQVIRKVDT